MTTGESTFLTVNDGLEKPRAKEKARQSLTAENSWPKGHYYYYKTGKWKSNYFLWVFICIEKMKFQCLLLWILVCKILIFPILADCAMDRSGTGNPSRMCARLYFPFPNYRLNVPTESQQGSGDAASRRCLALVWGSNSPRSHPVLCSAGARSWVVWELQMTLKSSWLSAPTLLYTIQNLAKYHLLCSGSMLFSML